jgi:hypothetical protein
VKLGLGLVQLEFLYQREVRGLLWAGLEVLQRPKYLTGLYSYRALAKRANSGRNSKIPDEIQNHTDDANSEF